MSKKKKMMPMKQSREHFNTHSARQQTYIVSLVHISQNQNKFQVSCQDKHIKKQRKRSRIQRSYEICEYELHSQPGQPPTTCTHTNCVVLLLWEWALNIYFKNVSKTLSLKWPHPLLLCVIQAMACVTALLGLRVSESRNVPSQVTHGGHSQVPFLDQRPKIHTDVFAGFGRVDRS